MDKKFFSHAKRIEAARTKSDVGCIAVFNGSLQEEQPYKKTEIVSQYLLQFIFPDTAFIFIEDEVVILTGPGKKLETLQKLNESTIENRARLTILECAKENTQPGFEKAVDIIVSAVAKGTSKKVATFLKDSDLPHGRQGQEWMSLLKSKIDKENLVELTAIFSDVSMVKDDEELTTMKMSCKIASRVMQKAFVRNMEDIADNEKKVKHSVLAEQMEVVMADPTKKLKMDNIEENALFDSCFFPIIQSGGEYDLNPGAESNDDFLSYDTILASLGVRYNGYCSHVARTYFMDPTAKQKDCYDLLLECQTAAMEAMKPGATLGSVYRAARKVVETKAPDLLDNFKKDCGWGIGIDFCDPTYVINMKNEKKIEADMTFSVCVGFSSVKLPDDEAAQLKTLKGGLFSCLLADTVVVTSVTVEGIPVDILTRQAKKLWGEIKYNISGGEDEDDEEADDDEDANKGGSEAQRRATRNATAQNEVLKERTMALEFEIAERQQIKMQKKAIKALASGAETSGANGKGSEVEIPEAYPSAKNYPKELVPQQIHCDLEKECVFLPIGCFHVPFHISTIKNVSKTDEERAAFLRINFFFPSASITKDMMPQTRAALEKYPELAYVKVLSFRSRDAHNLNHQLRLIKELQKRVKDQEKRIEDEKDLVAQKELVLLRDRGDLRARLDDVNLRPPLGRGKKCTGVITAHVNGFRFRTSKGETLDIIYSNIKHFFLQPSEGELVVLIHFQLKDPIMVGKKKTFYVQFFSEVVDSSAAVDNSRGRFESDEMEEEERERRLRKRLDNLYKEFAKQTMKIVENNNQKIGKDNDIDVLQHRELGFNGVPNKEMVLLQPTINALVNLTDQPPFVVTLDEVEHVHFERVDLGRSKNFDMVLILKSHMKVDSNEVPQRIQSVPMTSLDTIKRWLDEKDHITFTSGTMALNWKNVIPLVRDELERGIFWKSEDEEGEKKDVGWNFLLAEAPDEDEDDEDDESSFHGSSEEDEEGEGEDDDGSDDEDNDSDFDDLVDEDEEEDEPSAEDEDDEGEDWDELERKAADDDKKRDRRREDDDEANGSKKKKRKG